MSHQLGGHPLGKTREKQAGALIPTVMLCLFRCRTPVCRQRPPDCFGKILVERSNPGSATMHTALAAAENVCGPGHRIGSNGEAARQRFDVHEPERVSQARKDE